MKHLFSFNESKTKVQKKIEFLELLSVDLTDNGLYVKVVGTADCFQGVCFDSKYITMMIMDEEGTHLEQGVNFCNIRPMKEFLLKLKDVGMNYRSMGAGVDFAIIKFDKHGSMTNSQFID